MEFCNIKKIKKRYDKYRMNKKIYTYKYFKRMYKKFL